MRIPHAVLGPLAFGLGAALEAARVALQRPRPGDGRRLLIATGIGLLGLLLGGGRGSFAQLRFYAGIAAFATGVAWQFRERLIPRIGARLLLAWSLLALAALWNLDGHAGAWMLLALAGAAVAVANAFTDLDRNFGWQVLLFAGYVTTLVLLVILEWHVASWTGMNDFVDALATRSVVGNVVAGAAFFYVSANAWFVLALLPLPRFRGQSFGEGRAWEPRHRMRSVAVLVVLPLLLVANAWRQWVDPSRLILVSIALLPLVTNAQDHPGNGEAQRVRGERGAR